MPEMSRNFDFADTVEVIINERGPREKRFPIPKCLLIEKSDYFKAACNTLFREGIENTIKLSDVVPRTFDHFLFWVYKNEIPVNNDPAKAYNELTQLWIFADRFQDLKLRNAVIDAILAVHTDTRGGVIPGRDAINLAWANTMPGSTLRKLILDLQAYESDLNDLNGSLMAVDRAFVFEFVALLLPAARKGVKPKLVEDKSACFYHEHNAGWPKSKCKAVQ